MMDTIVYSDTVAYIGSSDRTEDKLKIFKHLFTPQFREMGVIRNS